MGGGNNNNNLYEVLGLNKECSEAELKNAYKNLALKWHPDRCSASGNFKHVEESKNKFQAIQQAYSVLSDVNKRFLYDVGVYDSDDDDDDNEGMADFMSEMAVMMSQNKPNGNTGESFEELKDLFEEMFESDIDSFGSTSQTRSSNCYSFGSSSSTTSNKRVGSSVVSNTITEEDFQGFSSLGMDCLEDILLNPNEPEGVNEQFVYEEPEDEFESPDIRAEFDYNHGFFYTKEKTGGRYEERNGTRRN